MKRLTISLSDELFDEIDAMPNKSQFVRRLIEQDFGLSTGDEFGPSKTVESLGIHDELIEQLQSKVITLENELKRVFEAIETTNFIVGVVDEKLDSVMSQTSASTSSYDATSTAASNTIRTNPSRQTVDQPAVTPSLEPTESYHIQEDISNNIDLPNSVDCNITAVDNIGASSGDDEFLKRAMIYLPIGTRMKRAIIENLLGRHFGRDVASELNSLIEQKTLTETVNDGISYLKR